MSIGSFVTPARKGLPKQYQRELGATEMICWMNVPGVRGKEALSSIELFAREVMPAFAEGAA